MSWFDRWLMCQECGATTSRPEEDRKPCSWCKVGQLRDETPAEAEARVRRHSESRPT